MTNLRLQELYRQLSQLRVRERHGQDVRAEIEKLLAEITRIENLSQPPPAPTTHSQNLPTQFNVDVGRDIIGSAVGPNATVNAEVISSGDVQQFQSSTTNHFSGNPGPYDYHPSYSEVRAGQLVEQTFSRIFWRAPRAVAVSILMLSPILAFFADGGIILGAVGVLTITPLCGYVLWQTRFYKIPEVAYQKNRILVISSWTVTIFGVVLVIVIAIIYYITMLFLTAITGTVREEIRRH